MNDKRLDQLIQECAGKTTFELKQGPGLKLFHIAEIQERHLREFAQALLRQQQEAMQPYLRHQHECALVLWVHGICNGPRPDCNCGLDTIVQRAAARE